MLLEALAASSTWWRLGTRFWGISQYAVYELLSWEAGTRFGLPNTLSMTFCRRRWGLASGFPLNGASQTVSCAPGHQA